MIGTSFSGIFRTISCSDLLTCQKHAINRACFEEIGMKREDILAGCLCSNFRKFGVALSTTVKQKEAKKVKRALI